MVFFFSHSLNILTNIINNRNLKFNSIRIKSSPTIGFLQHQLENISRIFHRNLRQGHFDGGLGHAVFEGDGVGGLGEVGGVFWGLDFVGDLDDAFGGVFSLDDEAADAFGLSRGRGCWKRSFYSDLLLVSRLESQLLKPQPLISTFNCLNPTVPAEISFSTVTWQIFFSSSNLTSLASNKTILNS